MTTTNCAVCNSVSSQKCGQCHQVSYCSKQHQKEHWKTHRISCCPYRICASLALGRYLQASRDIDIGEVILEDVPLVLGPKQVTFPVCLGCYAAVDGSYSCTKCGWPMCSVECELAPSHRPECQLSQFRQAKVSIGNFSGVNAMYECVTPLRCLYLRDHDHHHWPKLLQMESHLDKRKSSEVYFMCQSNVVDFIKGYLKIGIFSDEEIQRVCGAIDVNAFEIPGPDIIGMYAKACLLQHSCVPNSSRTFTPQMHVVLRAAQPIQKGSPITTSYTDPMWGTVSRQMFLRTTKYFECKCPRCNSPSELGTEFSSVRCGAQCPTGLMRPILTNGKPEAWKCNQCSRIQIGLDVEAMLQTIGQRLVTLHEASMASSENFLLETVKQLSENHFYRADVKLALCQMYGHVEGQTMNTLPAELLFKKEKMCRDLLGLTDFFCPGIARLRGLLLYELQATLLEKYNRLTETSKETDEQKRYLLQETMKCLQEASGILLQECPLQDEYQLGQKAWEQIEIVSEALSKLSNLS